MDKMEAFLNALELSAGTQTAMKLPFNMSDAVKQDDGLYKKEILSVGELIVDSKGRKFNFDSKFLKQLANNFNSGAIDYVPLLFTNEKNEHVMPGHPNAYGGTVKELSVDDPQNPTKLYGTFDLTEDTRKMVEHNPKFGVSVTAHPNYVDAPRSEYYGPMLLNVAGTHYPKVTRMGGWEKVPVMASNEQTDVEIIDLSDSEFINAEKEREVPNMEEKDKKPETGAFNLSDLMENEEFKTFLAGQIATATKAKDDQIAELSNGIDSLKSETYKQSVESFVEAYRGAGVPPVVLDMAMPLLLSFEGQESTEVINLSVTEGDEKKDVALNKMQVVAKMLDQMKGTVNLSQEKGSQEEVTGNLDKDARRAAAMQLAQLAKNV